MIMLLFGIIVQTPYFPVNGRFRCVVILLYDEKAEEVILHYETTVIWWEEVTVVD